MAEQSGFFQRKYPFTVALLAFFLLAIPLVFLNLFYADGEALNRLNFLYLILIGNTHFFVTLTLYMQSSNLAYFKSSRANYLLYFAIPIAIFVFFDLYKTFRLPIRFPDFNAKLIESVRVLNFYHFAFQAYGVLQLFKLRSLLKFSASVKRLELTFFGLIVSLMAITMFNQERWPIHSFLFQSLAGLAFVLLILLFVRYSSFGRPVQAMGYLSIQSLCAAAAIYRTSLYPFALAVHYVEYHFLMFPRCFETKLQNTTLDHYFGAIRANKLVFYSVLLFSTAGATLMIASSHRATSISSIFLLSAFDGIFVFHFFIDALTWRFRNPFYKKNIFPLYFSDEARGI